MKSKLLKILFRARKCLVIWKLKRELSQMKNLLAAEKCPVMRVARVAPIMAKQSKIALVAAASPEQVVGGN